MNSKQESQSLPPLTRSEASLYKYLRDVHDNHRPISMSKFPQEDRSKKFYPSEIELNAAKGLLRKGYCGTDMNQLVQLDLDQLDLDTDDHGDYNPYKGYDPYEEA